MKSFLAIVFQLTLITQLHTQNLWQLKLGGPLPETILQILPTSDGNLLILAQRDDDLFQAGIWLLKYTPSGQLLWQKDFQENNFELGRALLEAPDGTLYLGGRGLFYGQLYHLTAEGAPIKRYQFDHSEEVYSIALTADGNLLLGLGNNINNEPKGVLKIDTAGNILGKFEFNLERSTCVHDLHILPDGGVIIAGRTHSTGASGFKGLFFARFDAVGNMLWLQKFAYPKFLGISETAPLKLAWQPDHSVWVPMSGAESTLLKHISSEGAVLQDRHIDAVPDSDEYEPGVYNDGSGYLLLTGLPAFAARIKIPGSGASLLWSKSYTASAHSITAAHRMANGNLVFGGRYLDAGNFNITLFTTDSLGFQLPTAVTGSVWIDENANCQRDPGEGPAIGIAVETTNHQFLAITGSDGRFVLRVDTGVYDFQLSHHFPDMWLPTCPTIQQVQLTATHLVDSVEFSVLPFKDCPALEASVTAPELVRCDTTRYFINVCNRGSGTAFGARLKLHVDDRLLLLGSSEPFTLSGDVLEYDLGDLPPGACHQFNITVRVPCGLPLGAACCVEARATPNAICWEQPDPQWNGGEIEVRGRCHKGRAEFTVHNIGTGSATVPYRLFEDDALSEKGSLNLAPGDSAFFWRSGLGRTVQLHTGQAPGYPGISRPGAILETCGLGPNGFYSHGFYNMLPADDGKPSVSQACVPVSDVYSPGHIAENLPGIGPGHWVMADLGNSEFTARLYNPLDHPVDSVVLNIELSRYHDTITFQPLASSHPYSWHWASPHTARVIFKDAGLASFAADKLHGSVFFRFRVKPFPDLPVNALGQLKLECHATAVFEGSAQANLEEAYNYIFPDTFPNQIQPLAPDEVGMKYFGAGVADFGEAIALSPRGSIYIAGSSRGYSRRNCLSVILTNAEGVGQWHRVFDLGAPAFVTGAQATENGRCIISGVVLTHGDKSYIEHSSAFLLCVNSKGEIVWKKIFRVNGVGTVSYNLISSSDGAYLISGATEMDNAGNYHFFLHKFRADGDSLWQHVIHKAYQYPVHGNLHCLVETADNGYLMASLLLDDQVSLFKTDHLGHLIWMKQHYVASSHRLGMAKSPDGGFLLAMDQGVETGLLRLDAFGNIVWGKNMATPAGEIWRLVDITPAPFSGYLIGCQQLDDLQDSWNVGMARIDENGQLLWTQTYRSYGPVADHVSQVFRGGKRLYLLGNTQASFLYGIYKINTMLIMTDLNGKLIGIQDASERRELPEQPAGAVLLQPNPATHRVRVQWPNQTQFPVNWAILDNNGRLMRQGRENQTAFDVSVGDLPAGLYWIHLSAGNDEPFIERLVVQR